VARRHENRLHSKYGDALYALFTNLEWKDVMTTLKKRLLVTAIIAVLAVIGSVMNSQQQTARAAGGPTITIDPTQLPLPVQGSLGVSGTVAATQSGIWNVGITGTPNVAITGIPLFKNVDEPGRSPFQSGNTAEGGGCSAALCTLGTVFVGPKPNTRLVVKDVSIRLQLNPGGKVAYAQLFSCPTPNALCDPQSLSPTIEIPLSLQASSAMVESATGPFDVWVANQQVDLYVEAGSVPQIWCVMDSKEFGVNGSAFVLASVSGYT
jgi:hypothetical protein